MKVKELLSDNTYGGYAPLKPSDLSAPILDPSDLIDKDLIIVDAQDKLLQLIQVGVALDKRPAIVLTGSVTSVIANPAPGLAIDGAQLGATLEALVSNGDAELTFANNSKIEINISLEHEVQ